MSLVGYYQASERLDDTALAPVGERVAQKIRDQFNDAVAFVVSRWINHNWEAISFSFQD
jgi:guanine deaminase